MSRLVIIGAKADGQLPVALEAIEATKDLQVVALIDDDKALWGQELLGLPVLGGMTALVAQAPKLRLEAAFIAVGDPAARGKLAAQVKRLGLALPAIVHPAAYVSARATIAEGGFIGAGVQVLPGATIGQQARINAGAVISHHVRLGCHVTIGPNATLTGRSEVCDYAFIGAGSTVLNEVQIGDHAIVGAGAVVTHDVAAGLTVAGVPARPLNK